MNHCFDARYMVTIQKARRILGGITGAALLALAACGDDEETKKSYAPFVVNAADVEQLVSVRLEPTMAAEAISADGALRLVVPAGAVTEAVELTMGKLKASARPAGVVGDVYVLGPDGLVFAEPVRLHLKLAASANADGLRPVHLDTGTGSYEVLSNWAYLPSTTTLAGDIAHLSAYGASDGSGPSLTGGTPAGGAAIGDDLLAAHEIAAARDAYLAAVAASPSNLQAQLGAALTRLALLPEHEGIDDLLTLCGQPLADIQGQVFGSSGLVAWAIAHRQGFSSVQIEAGAELASLTALDFQPNGVRSELWTGSEPGEASISIRASDLRVGEEGEVSLEIDVTDPAGGAWVDGNDVDLTRSASGIYVHVWREARDSDDDSNWTRLASGTLHVVSAGSQDGDAVEVELRDVVIEEMAQPYGQPAQVVGVVKVSGTLRDTLKAEFEPAPGSMPFVDLEYIEADPNAIPPTPARSEPVQLIEACGPTLTEAYLKARLDELVDELSAIRAHLDAIAAAPDAAAFVWSLPTGAVANGTPIPIGIVEVHLARAALFAIAGANELVQQYQLIGAETVLRDLFGDYTSYWEDCYQSWVPDDQGGGSYQTVCDEGDELRHDIDLGLVFAALDTNFLTALAGKVIDAASVATAKADFMSTVQALLAALNAAPTAEVLFDFQAPGAVAASAELSGFLQLVLASFTADAVVTETPEWVLRAHHFFSNPFTKASLLAAIDDPSITSLWSFTPRDDVERTNAELAPQSRALEEMLSSFLGLPDFPQESMFCNSDVDCQGVDGRSYWECSGWEEQGVCSHDANVSCSSTWDCESVSSGSVCRRDTCAPRSPAFFDGEVVGDAFDQEPPAFVNRAVWDSLRDGL